MKHEGHIKTAFERECGTGIRFISAKERNGTTDISFEIVGRSIHTIGTHPLGTGRQQLEDAAAQAGRWARVMADRAAAA